MTLLERFEQKYIPEPNSGCWLWFGRNITKWQYGTIRLSHPRRWELAHRVSYKLHRGDIPPGMCVLHRCDNPCCVNPEHLFLGDRKDIPPRGANNHKAKLTDDMVREIRLSRDPARRCAHRFGVSHVTINKVRRRATWAHVK